MVKRAFKRETEVIKINWKGQRIPYRFQKLDENWKWTICLELNVSSDRIIILFYFYGPLVSPVTRVICNLK